MARSGSIHIDAHELRELDLDLGQAPLRVRINATQALGESARDIDREMTIDAAGHQGNLFGRPGTQFEMGLDRHVSHELLTPLSAEIGIENEGSGSLAHIVAYGSAKNAPAYDPYAGPTRAFSRIDHRFADAAEEAAFGRKGVN